MTDLNNSLRLPLDPYLHNSTSWWWNKNSEHLGTDSKFIYSEYQEWMREQGVIIRDPNTTISGIYFVDEYSMLMFCLRWSN
jgi:hypothetical protein